MKNFVSRKDAFFGIHTDLHAQKNDANIGESVDEEMLERFIEAVKPDYVQCDCKGHFGYTSYPTKIGQTAPGLEKDLLGIWRKVTKKHGISLTIHYSGVIDEVAIKKHPEWAAVDAEGNCSELATSLFGSYIDELMIPQLKEVITNYDVDAVWVDGECWGPILDYCQKAIEALKDNTGIEDAPKSPDNPHWQTFMDFNRERFREYVRHYVDVLHEFKPEFQLTSNLMYSPVMPEHASIPLDFLSGDFMAEEGMDLARLTSRYMPSVGLPWDMMTWGHTKGKSQYNWSIRPASQLKQEAASVIAQGGGWQFVAPLARSGYIDDFLMNAAADVAEFCRQRRQLCHKSQSVPQVALLLPENSIYDMYNKRSIMFGLFIDKMRPLMLGPLHGLLELHYSVDVKAEHHLSGHMHNYPVIVVPDCHKLDEDFIAELKDYAHSGGRLLLGGPQVASFFKDEIGVSFDSELIDMDKVYRELEERIIRKDWSFLHPDLPQLYVIDDEIAAACPGLYREVTPTTAEPINYYYPARDARSGAKCASSIVKYGKGVIAAIHVSLTKNYYESHFPVLRRAFGEVMSRVFPEPMVELDAPNCIDVSIKKKDGKIMIHLLNTSGMGISSNYVAADYIPPVMDVKMIVRLDAEPARIDWAYGGNSKKINYDKGILSLVLDKLDIHDILVIAP